MSNSNNQEEVKEFVQVVAADNTATDEEIEDATEGIEEEDTSDQSSDQETETEEESSDDEPETVDESNEKDDGLKKVQNESPRERALRLEVTRLKATLRQKRSDELFVNTPKVKEEIENDEELNQYDPEELKQFEKLALKMGFAKKSEIIHQTIQERLDNEFQSFMEEHPEYAPENDKDGLLWNQLKEEFQLYQPPKDPKTLKKVLSKIHNDISGIKPVNNNLNKIKASQEKIKVASHNGASANKTQTRAPVIKSSSNVRTDALKGFTDEEINDLLAD